MSDGWRRGVRRDIVVGMFLAGWPVVLIARRYRLRESAVEEAIRSAVRRVPLRRAPAPQQQEVF